MNRPFAAYACLGAVLFSVTATPSAAEIEANMSLSFHERASLNAGIDVTKFLDSTLAAQRLVNERLGNWTGTSIQFLPMEYRVAVAVNDPGVGTPPAEDRQLVGVSVFGQLGGDLLGGASVVSDASQTYVCPAGNLMCNTLAHVSTFNPAAPQSSLTSIEQALGGLQVRADAAQFQILFPGTTVRLGAVPAPPTNPINPTESFHELKGTIRYRATYESKSRDQYVADALAATDSPGLGWPVHLTTAAADVAQLRATNYQSFTPLPGRSIVAGIDDLRVAAAVLSTARDAAKWQAQGAATGGTLNTDSAIVTQLWNVTALSEPGLGRAQAGFAGEPTFLGDATLELAVVRASLASSDANSFMDRLAFFTGAGMAVAGPTPLLTLDGADYGLQGAMLQLFFTAGSGDGSFQINLPSATRHALWKSSSLNNITLLEGTDLIVDGWGEATLAGDSIYVGESARLLNFSGNVTQLGLDNYYSADSVVVASWGVTSPVPEPSGVLMLSAGLGLFMWRLRRRHTY